ncbi:hypothetical protein T10_9664 [Trichinella papuae]|uniref:DUF5641 domain-containing protein n=1 Tax=Trichinella papuae TaxID=268474 RepID=A0A0V1N997_9BILA|nr:hypothetical protein T10_9664 [Trichinella papuae]
MWRKWKKELNHLSTIRVPRALMSSPREQHYRIELHIFGDSSWHHSSAPTHARNQLQLMNHLWKRWVEEYLVTLTARGKWAKIGLQPENGDLVFLVEEGVTSGSWVRSRRRCRGVTVSLSHCGCGPPGAFRLVRVDHGFSWN